MDKIVEAVAEAISQALGCTDVRECPWVHTEPQLLCECRISARAAILATLKAIEEPMTREFKGTGSNKFEEGYDKGWRDAVERLRALSQSIEGK